MPDHSRTGGRLTGFRLVGLLACLVLLLLPSKPAVAELAVPRLVGRVNDYAGMMSPQARSLIEQKLRTLDDAESTQIAILTVPSLGGEPIEAYSMRVAEAWKLGRKGRDNGILLVVSKGDRKVRIEVGYGLEGRVTDLQSGRITRDILRPAFARGDFDAGFIGAADALVALARGEYSAPAGRKAPAANNVPSVPLILLILFLLFLLIRAFRGFWGGPFGFGGPGGGIFPGGGIGGGMPPGSPEDDGFSGGGGGFGGGGASDEW